MPPLSVVRWCDHNCHVRLLQPTTCLSWQASFSCCSSGGSSSRTTWTTEAWCPTRASQRQLWQALQEHSASTGVPTSAPSSAASSPSSTWCGILRDVHPLSQSLSSPSHNQPQPRAYIHCNVRDGFSVPEPAVLSERRTSSAPASPLCPWARCAASSMLMATSRRQAVNCTGGPALQ